jgi:hypothetical protein
MVLIVTGDFDPPADHVEQKLRKRGIPVVRFDPGKFPAEAALSVEFSPLGAMRAIMRLPDEEIDLGCQTGVWYRRPNRPVAHESIQQPMSRDFVDQEARGVMQDVWDMLDCPWVPAKPAVIRRAQLKATQLRQAASLGFELPPTLISNDPSEFLEFYRQHNGQIVSKVAGFAFLDTVGQKFSRYTEVVTKRDVAYARSVRYCPAIFQAYVPKRVELRITVVGNKVFAAEIHSQRSNHTRHDWRRYALHQTPHLPHDLPEAIERRCLDLVALLGLRYGAIDMIVTPDERYVFLELNPNGQFTWIEELTGLPISDALCDLFTSPSESPSRGFASSS